MFQFFKDSPIPCVNKHPNIDSEERDESSNYAHENIHRNKPNIYGDLSISNPRKLAVISGAGIAGLAASIELASRGYRVIIAEKRDAFTRKNVINLDVSVQQFLNKHHLLELFERDVAAKIDLHQTIHFNNNHECNVIYESSKENPFFVKQKDEIFDINNMDQLFNQDALYSARIKDIQTFLTKKAFELNVYIYGNTEVNVSNKSIRLKSRALFYDYNFNKITPDLFFVAEGVHSSTADKLGMHKEEIENACTGENWIFGNAPYYGQKTWVSSVLDTSDHKLKIANVIFNGKANVINVAVMVSKSSMTVGEIRLEIYAVLNKILKHEKLEHLNVSIHDIKDVVKKPVQIKNEKRRVFSMHQTMCIGDTAGHSSPLAGMGGTLGLTLTPRIIENFLNDFEKHAPMLNRHANIFSEAAVMRWFCKSDHIKKMILSLAASDVSDLRTKEEHEASLDGHATMACHL